MTTLIPTNYLLVKRKDGSFIKENNSYIYIASVLYKKLQKTGLYYTDNLPQLMSLGKLNLLRKDGKSITVETNCSDIVKKLIDFCFLRLILYFFLLGILTFNFFFAYLHMIN